MTGLEAIVTATNKIIQWVNKKFESCDADTLDGYHAENFITKDNVDAFLDEDSENPVQNRTIATAIGGLTEDIDAIVIPTKLSEFENDTNYLITETDPTVPNWAKTAQKPTYTADEVGADSKGSAEDALTNAQSYTDTKISELINGAPTTLDTLGEIATAIGSKADADHEHSAENIISGTIPIERGGTGQTSGSEALNVFFAAGNTVLSVYQYGTELPSAGTPGRIFFKKV